MRGYKRLDQDDPDRLLWGVYQFAVTCIIIGLIAWPISKIWAETVWTDFSPKIEEIEEVEEVTYVAIEETVTELSAPKADLDKEKYRQYFEDKSLVLMVLGGIEYWHMNCGELSVQGKYFMALAIKKHEIDPEEMHMDMSFQTGLFAAQLYNSCDHFLQQVKSIGLDMMFVIDPSVLPQPEAINNIQNSEV